MPLTAQLQAVVGASDIATVTAPDVGTVAPTTHTVAVQKVLDLAAGTGAGQVDVLYQDTNTLAASANTDIDLSGALARAIGGTAVFARVRGLYIAASAANTNNVIVGAAATNPWITLIGTATGTLILRPGAWILAGVGSADATGWAVTAGTGDLLRIANSGAGTTVDYTIVVVGTSV